MFSFHGTTRLGSGWGRKGRIVDGWFDRSALSKNKTLEGNIITLLKKEKNLEGTASNKKTRARRSIRKGDCQSVPKEQHSDCISGTSFALGLKADFGECELTLATPALSPNNPLLKHSE